MRTRSPVGPVPPPPVLADEEAEVLEVAPPAPPTPLLEVTLAVDPLADELVVAPVLEVEPEGELVSSPQPRAGATRQAMESQ